MMIVYVKNMVCSRCKMMVTNLFEDLVLHPEEVNLGEIRIREESIADVKEELRSELQKLGFDLLDNKKSRTIEKIKNLITDLVQNRDAQLDMNLSDYLSGDRKSTRLNSSHVAISYAVFCLKKKKQNA